MKKAGYLIITGMILFALAACSGLYEQTQAVPTAETVPNQAEAAQEIPAAQATVEGVMTTEELEAAGAGAASAADAMAENSETHEDAADYTWDESVEIPVALTGSAINIGGAGVVVDGSTATIQAAGTYRLSGSLSDGQIIVDTGDEDVVRLILDGVDLNCSNNTPLLINKAKKAVIILAENTSNTVTDGASYVFADVADDEANATIFSKADLSIAGSGSLSIYGNYNDGISSKDGLILAGGTIRVMAIDDGIRGKDYLVLKDTAVTVDSGGDGLKSDNENDTDKGYVSIESGSVQVTSGGDAVDAGSDAMVTGGELTLVSGGGSSQQADGTISTKGINGRINVNIDGGTITIDAADDAINSNGSLVINSGRLTIASGDDGVHTDSTLTINDGVLEITKSYEGIESAVITINGGDINILASDDGVNVAGGNDGSGGWGPGGGIQPGGGGPGGRRPPDGTRQAPGEMQGIRETIEAGGELPEGMPMMQGTPPAPGEVPQGMPGGGFGMDAFAATGDYHLDIHGGTIIVDAGGDGIDTNGTIEMTDGVIIVNGPTENMNSALDFDSFNISGGLVVAAGSSGMAQAPGGQSSQNSLLLNFTSVQPAGTLFHLQDTDGGKEILTFAPAKDYQSIAFSSADLVSGTSYDVYSGGSSSGTNHAGLYEDGNYTPGSPYTSFTISNNLTGIGSSGNRP